MAQRFCLSFRGFDAEVLTDDVDIDSLKQVAEAKFSLQPQTYDFYDEHGKVETSAALKRSLLMSDTSEVFAIEARERPEWANMRKMQDMIAALAEQVETGFSDMWASINRTDSQVRCNLAPFVQNLAMSQIDMRSELLGVAARADKADQVLAPLMQSVAMEQIDTRAKLELLSPLAEIDIDSVISEIEKVGEDVKRLREFDWHAQASFKGLQDEVRHATSELGLDLRKEIQCMRDDEKVGQKALKALQADVRRLEQVTPREPSKIEVAGWTVPTTSAMAEDTSLRPDFASSRGTASGRSSSGHFSYSKKAPPFGAKDAVFAPTATGTSAPFARSCATPLRFGRERLPGCRSLPQLPPVS
jgi:hypothetical protein|eukprot:TRINITY_DN77062_c0_g1_i1.p1 TRINITY_DN77062_c0_g1~~TRINITY_DN77062_c0_g1_i1.p1  ORF type:complete len:387 (-),score=80.13 TRINITY_DN77062_c0_g1_i1:219-1295(-)